MFDLEMLIGKSFLEGCKALELKKEDFEINIDSSIRMNGIPQGQIVDLDCIYFIKDAFGDIEKYLVTFTLTEDFEEDEEEAWEKDGHWSYAQIDFNITLEVEEEVYLLDAIESIGNDLYSRENIFDYTSLDTVLETQSFNMSLVRDSYINVEFSTVEEAGISSIIQIESIEVI